MHAHLVHAHPEERSFVAAMRDVVAQGLEAQGHTLTTSDLYAMNFDPVAKAGDFAERADPGYLNYAKEQRHGHETGTLAPDIAAEIEKVLAADLLVFTFPVWWFGPPAILKGWIERVFLSGPFYGGRRIYGRGGLKGKRAFAAVSLGGRDRMFGPNGIHGPLVDGMLRPFFQGTLGYVGLAVHEPYVAYHAPYVGDAARRAMLGELASCVRGLDDRPVLPVPDLEGYDETLAPKA